MRQDIPEGYAARRSRVGTDSTRLATVAGVMATSADHPRPFLQRAWTSLDGPWDFSLDRELGFRTPTSPPFDQKIIVPFAPETPAAGVGAVDGYAQQCWYRRRLDVAPPIGDERILVHFGGVDRIADVWANGAHVGRHVGGYVAFDVDITEQATAGVVELVVRATDDGHDLSIPRGKQDWQPVPHSIFYPRTTGIWKTVWVERVPAVRIADISWIADVEAMTVTTRVRIVGAARRDRLELRVVLRADLSDQPEVLVDDTIGVTGRGSTRDVERTFALGTGSFDERFALTWWPISPTIIDARLTLSDGATVIDSVESYTALRSVEVSNGQFLLNGRPYPLRLVLDQGYWPETGATPPDVDALRRDIELTKALGFNGARKHQKTEDPRYFALADRLGLLTWVEMPSAFRSGPDASASLLREWGEIVESHRNHPSVVVWVPINESWGVGNCEHDAAHRALIEALAATSRALDGTRPVSANDGWETVGGDVVGVHDYDQDPAALAFAMGRSRCDQRRDRTTTTRRPHRRSRPCSSG